MPTLGAQNPCLCGRVNPAKKGVPYAACCGRWLDGAEVAPDAESLMRSRYTAFVLQRQDYLLATWHRSTRPEDLEFEAGAKWLGLEVKASAVQDAAHAEVEFVARQRHAGGSASRLHERSRFVCEQGRWYYLNGTLL